MNNKTNTSKGNILIVDDIPENIRLLASTLKKQGYKVRKAINGSMALTGVQAFLPDLILLDIMMPDMDGYQVCEKLKADEQTRNIPIIFISALDDMLDKVKAFKVGGVDYISKPFQTEEVLARVETHLSLQTMQNQLNTKNHELEQLVEQLHLQNALLKAQQEATVDGILVIDENDNISFYNRQFLKLWHIPPEIVQQGDYNILSMYITSQLKNPTDILTGAEYIYNYKNEIMYGEIYLKDGRVIERHFAPILAHDRQNHGRVWYFRDITERKSAEAIIQKSNQRLIQLNHQMMHELNLAREIQAGLLPPSNPNISNFEIICFTQPAREVGGDFYSYHVFDENHVAVVVGDVSGKGVSAALLMATSLSQLEASFTLDLTPEERLAHLDHAMVPYTKQHHQNCAMCYVELTTVENENLSKSTTLQVVNAGCLYPYVRRKDGSVIWLEVGGMPLGVGLGAEVGYHTLQTDVSKGDMVILMSDGLVEAYNMYDEMFGFERLKNAISQANNRTIKTLLADLQNAVLSFIDEAEPHDDMTIVVVQI
ncbi:MAG: hypothetical protein B6242_09920 [Anaerolineaceae bacterium 4572_78]|nr:MAG: hypothetical protein B6242_09920 [Anaerolineaceae bacterium 4572_78]